MYDERKMTRFIESLDFEADIKSTGIIVCYLPNRKKRGGQKKKKKRNGKEFRQFCFDVQPFSSLNFHQTSVLTSEILMTRCYLLFFINDVSLGGEK